jgi:hypothetical protein
MTPPPPRVEHTDVGAYALGLLDDADRHAFELHLNTCRSCRAELAALAEVAVTLSNVDTPQAVRRRPLPTPDPADSAVVTDLMLRRAEVQRRQRRTRLLLSAAAAAVLLTGGVAVGTSFGSGSGGGKPPNAVNAAMTGEQHEATDSASGAHGVVALQSLQWGTKVGLELSKVTGPETCQLIAVRGDGTERVVVGWSVSPKGYGLPTNPKPLVVDGGVEFARGQIKRFDVRTTSGHTLLSIPV